MLHLIQVIISILCNKDYVSKLNLYLYFTAMFKINAHPSSYLNGDDTLNKLETVLTPLGSLQLIETDKVDYIIAGLGRNVYFPPNTSKSYHY